MRRPAAAPGRGGTAARENPVRFQSSPVQKAFDRLFDRSLDRRRGAAGVGIRILRFLFLGSREFRHDGCWERAATLSFTTVLSLLPIAVLVLSVLSIPARTAQLRSFFIDTVVPYLAASEELQNEIKATIETEITADVFRLGAGTSVFVILGLIVASVALLVSAERVFGRIWKVQTSRTYFQKIVAFWMILTTSPLLITLSLYVEQKLGTQFSGAHPAFKTLYEVLIPVVISCFAFSVIYLFLPHTKVRLLPALIGAVVAGLLWEALKAGFVLYAHQASKLTSLYGSLGMVPIFLIFVYLTWTVILWGGELSYTAQHYRRLVRDLRLHRRTEESGRYSPVLLGLALLEHVARAYRAGRRGALLESVADSLDCYTEEFQPIVRRLVDTGVLVESAQEPGRFVPGRDPAAVRLDTVVADLVRLESRELPVGDLDDNGRDLTEAGKAFLEARRSYLGSFEDRTLEDLAPEQGDRPGMAGAPFPTGVPSGDVRT